jgi:hypothetical protein
MLCYISYMNVDKTNIDKWEKVLIKTKNKSLSLAEKRLLEDYGVYDLNEYIDLIKSNIENLSMITDNFNQRKKERLELEEEKNKEDLEMIIKNSIKISKIDNNIIIKLLVEDNRKKAIELYQKFKEDNSIELENNIDDFILKNIIFGIFEKEELAGIIIIIKRKFTIGEKISTFYIQELFIDENYRKRGFADLLFKYAILLCPTTIANITFMTSSSNIPMINIAKKYNFILYEKTSGDCNNPLLYIRNNDSLNIEEIKSAFL